MKKKVERNKKLVELRDKQHWSWRALARSFKIKHPTAIKIYNRDKRDVDNSVPKRELVNV